MVVVVVVVEVIRFWPMCLCSSGGGKGVLDPRTATALPFGEGGGAGGAV